ncbi:GGDEF domain-containing protein [Roseateles chitosanitabidus]|jgi:diguanylate cyclase (GGDEF)-like protein|uniref:GGDEF domain-containing protein n=1 Tax=Roseateles chitosanitabidus TaxID=65048 RepID=UPI000830D176|nr:GGDEF domain-containing protein [Roseateles chitosanitabidus]MBO9685765.1 GGDEF domain-containing protein [Roseateles chitosanitabidus]
MRFDVPTLFSLMLILSLALALLLPLLLGWGDSQGARRAQLCAAAQAAGWALLLLPPEGMRLTSTVALGLLSGSVSLLWLAADQWVPGRFGRWIHLGMPVLVMVGYGVGWDNYGLRLAWSNGCIGLQMLALCASLLQPVKRGPSGNLRWRLLLVVSMGLLALLNLARAYLAGFDTAHLPRFDAPHPLNMGFAVMANICVLTAAIAVLVAWRGETEAELRRLTQLDAATGLANRRAFQQRSVDMISMARRYAEPLMLLVMDLDGAKAINATHGELKGDQAITLFGRCLDEQKRLGDVVARIDGQRFAVLMARSDLVGPPALDRRLRDALLELAPRELGFTLGYSAGWAKLRNGDRNIEDLLHRAEAALYAAKRQGKGRLCAEPGLEAELSVAATTV